MGNNSNQNGWNEYSRLVLAEIETLNNKVDAIVKENNAIKQELSKLEQFKDEITCYRNLKSLINNARKVIGIAKLSPNSDGIIEPKKIPTKVEICQVIQQVPPLANK